MKKTNLISVLLFVVGLAGCTSPATKQAIQFYQKTNQYTELSFDNSMRIANEQMLLNLTQYTKEHANNPELVTAAIKTTWEARNQLEICREQYMLSRALSMMTVGVYLYDSQGWLNSIFGDTADILKYTSSAVDAANKAAGITSVKQLIPTGLVQPNSVNTFNQVLKQTSGK